MEKDMIAFWIALAVTIIALIASIGYFNYNQTEAIRTNIETAIAKGIDPLSVRCAYSNSHDNVCITYAARK